MDFGGGECRRALRSRVNLIYPARMRYHQSRLTDAVKRPHVNAVALSSPIFTSPLVPQTQGRHRLLSQGIARYFQVYVPLAIGWISRAGLCPVIEQQP